MFARVTVDPATAWNVISDHERMPEWTPARAVALEPSGKPRQARCGCGWRSTYVEPDHPRTRHRFRTADKTRVQALIRLASPRLHGPNHHRAKRPRQLDFHCYQLPHDRSRHAASCRHCHTRRACRRRLGRSTTRYLRPSRFDWLVVLARRYAARHLTGTGGLSARPGLPLRGRPTWSSSRRYVVPDPRW